MTNDHSPTVRTVPNDLVRLADEASQGHYYDENDTDSWRAHLAVILAAVLERVASEIEAQLVNYPLDVFPEPTPGAENVPDLYAASAMRTAYKNAARIARGGDDRP
jgi:hypothetical protein